MQHGIDCTQFAIVLFVTQVNQQRSPVNEEQCVSNVSHAKLLSRHVQLHNGVWLVNDNVQMHDTFVVKLAVCNTKNYCTMECGL